MIVNYRNNQLKKSRVKPGAIDLSFGLVLTKSILRALPRFFFISLNMDNKICLASAQTGNTLVNVSDILLNKSFAILGALNYHLSRVLPNLILVP